MNRLQIITFFFCEAVLAGFGADTADFERLRTLLQDRAGYDCTARTTHVKNSVRNVCISDIQCRIRSDKNATPEGFAIPCSHSSTRGCQNITECVEHRIADIEKVKKEGGFPDLEFGGAETTTAAEPAAKGMTCEYRNPEKKPISLIFKKENGKRALICASPVSCSVNGMVVSDADFATCEPIQIKKVADKVFMPECPSPSVCRSKEKGIESTSGDVKITFRDPGHGGSEQYVGSDSAEYRRQLEKIDHGDEPTL